MRFISTASITILILIAVLMPGSNIPDIGFDASDKLAHFTMFYVWSVAIRFDFSPNFNWRLGWLAGLTFSILTEVLQLFVEGRTFDYWDILLDTIGVTTGLLAGSFTISVVRDILIRILKK